MQIPANAPIAAGNGLADVNLPRQTTPKPEAAEDTVKLSPYAMAKHLKEQGASNSVIAAQLGLDVKTVNTYFGTPVTAAVTTPQPFSPVQEAVQKAGVKEQGQAAPPAKK